jgi:hypothetical protein
MQPAGDGIGKQKIGLPDRRRPIYQGLPERIIVVSGFFAQRFETFSAHIDGPWLTILKDGSPLDVRQPPPFDRHFGVAHMVPELGPFVTDFALCHNSFPPIVMKNQVTHGHSGFKSCVRPGVYYHNTRNCATRQKGK